MSKSGCSDQDSKQWDQARRLVWRPYLTWVPGENGKPGVEAKGRMDWKPTVPGASRKAATETLMSAAGVQHTRTRIYYKMNTP